MKLQTRSIKLPDDPLKVFSRLAGEHEYCFLLETLADKYQPQTSGQSYIGVAPSSAMPMKYAAVASPATSSGVLRSCMNRSRYAGRKASTRPVRKDGA